MHWLQTKRSQFLFVCQCLLQAAGRLQADLQAVAAGSAVEASTWHDSFRALVVGGDELISAAVPEQPGRSCGALGEYAPAKLVQQ